MTDHLFRAAFAAGLAALAWVGFGYLPNHPLALAMTLLIAAFYVAGALELQRFGRDTRALDAAVSALPPTLADLADWLPAVPTTLRDAVRQRVEGGRSALPGPALAPYLAGLLVLLGMTGTFLGMVLTLNGTGQALQHASDLQTMRESLAAPVRGLGLAFGTSVAGVAASAMLGLMAALARRQRQQASARLDQALAGPLRPFTPAHQRQQALQWQRAQAEQWPLLVDRLQALAQQLDTQARDSADRLLVSQERHQQQADARFGALATSLDTSLQQGLAESARLAAATLQPVVTQTLDGVAQQTHALHQRVADLTAQQLADMAGRFDTTTQAVAAGWQAALQRHEQGSADQALRLQALFTQAGRDLADEGARVLAGLAQTMQQSQARWQAELAAGDTQRLAAWQQSLAATADTLQRRWQQAGDEATRQHERIAQGLDQAAARASAQAEAQARATIDQVARLVDTAAQAPQAAAEVVAQLRGQLSDSLARDNALLDERSRTLATLNTLLDTVQHAAQGQRAAIDDLVASTSSWLQQAGQRLDEQARHQAEHQQALAVHLSASAAEVASLGEAFGVAVDLFARSSERLSAQLQQVHDTLGRSISRSDEQLAYYVAQAREVIDLSLASQKQIVDDLQRVAARRQAQPSEA